MLTAKYKVLNCNKPLSKFGKNFCTEVSLLTGRGVLIPVQVFHEVGLYDEKHFQQCGDIDFPIRAKNMGYNLIVSYDAVAKSHVESTFDTNVSDFYTLKDLKRYFFDVKSNYRLKYHFFFSLNTSKNFFYFISFLICDFLRICWHFLVRLRFRQINKSTT
jgi:GT2 family glycosyltransferase